MRLVKPLLPMLVLTLVAAAALAGTASAKAIYTYSVEIREAVVFGTASADVTIQRVDSSQSSTVRVTHLGVETYRSNGASGNTTRSVSPPALTSGDVIEVYQPQIAAGPPGVSPDESFTVPPVGIAGAAGVPTISGQAPDGAISVLDFRNGCYAASSQDYTLTPSGNTFSVPLPAPIAAGTRTRLRVFPGGGDEIEYSSRIDGETACLYVDGFSEPKPPGQPPSANPFYVAVQNLRPGAATDIRVVMRRGSDVYKDTTVSASTEGNFSFSTQPLPGDVVDVYRPAAAPTPAYSFTLPKMSAVFDPENDLLVVDGDGFSWVSGSVLNAFVGGSSYRSVFGAPAGRIVFDFSQPADYDEGTGIDEGASASVNGGDLSDRVQFSMPAVRGDLQAPGVSAAVAKAFKLKSLKKKIKLSIHSSESASVKITLALPKNLPTRKRPKAKKTTKTQSVAKRSAKLKPGKNSVSLTFSKSGLRALAQLRSVGSRLKPVPLTVTIVARDAAGNAKTVVQQGRVAR